MAAIDKAYEENKPKIESLNTVTAQNSGDDLYAIIGYFREKYPKEWEVIRFRQTTLGIAMIVDLLKGEE